MAKKTETVVKTEMTETTKMAEKTYKVENNETTETTKMT